MAGGSAASGTASSSGAAAANNQQSAIQEELIVPADEHFVRCPVSKEIFENIWDEDEGEYMYRNAVKLFVTEAADSMYFKLGRPTSANGVRYLIVQKVLVLDSLLAKGKAASLKTVLQQYTAATAGARSRSADVVAKQDALLKAAAEDHPEDVFVLLDPVL